MRMVCVAPPRGQLLSFVALVILILAADHAVGTDSASSRIPCSIKDSCSVPESTHLTYVDRNCFCDDMCALYGDCCQDYEPSSTAATESPESSTDDSHSTHNLGSCQRVEAIDHRVEISIVTSCPRHFEDEAVKLRCEQKIYSDVFYDTPVTGVESKILYQNLFCAQCAGEVNISFWNLKIGCGEVPILTNVSQVASDNPHALIDHVMTADNKDRYFCTIEYHHPLYPVRHCKSHLGKCHRAWTNRKTKRKCKTHTSYVYAGKQVFKNKYCAQCNYINDSYTSCNDTRSPRFNTKGLWDSTAPFTIIIDPDHGSGTVKYGSPDNPNGSGAGGASSTADTHIAIARCSKFEVYDPFSKRCRKVMCMDPSMSPICIITTTPLPTTPTTMMTTTLASTTPSTTTTMAAIIVDGTDIDDMYINVDNNLGNIPGPLSSDKDCFLKMLNESDYEEFNNGTIYVQSTRQILTPVQYQRIGIYIAICSPDGTQGNLNSDIGNPLVPVLMFQFNDTQKMVSFIGLVISLVCLFILFVLHLLLKPLRTTTGRCVMSLCVALFGAQSLFLLGLHTAQTITTCFIMSVAIHYAFLVSFFWMNVLAIDMLHTVTTAAITAINNTSNGVSPNGATLTSSNASLNSGSPCRFVAYSFYAWGIPALIAGCAVAMEYIDIAPLYRPHYGRMKLCWITSRNSLLYFFALPLVLLLAVNIILFICTLRHMFSSRRTIHRRQITTQKAVGGVPYRPGVPIGGQAYKLRNRGRLTFYIQYCFIVGLTWIFAFVASLTHNHGYLWYAFTGLLVLQAFVLCIACLLNKKTLRVLRSGGRVHRSPNTPTRYSCARESNGKHLFYHYDEDEEVIGAQETSI